MATYTFEHREYLEDVIESQGFYVTNNYGREIPCGIVKIDEKSAIFEKAKKAAVFAVNKYNEKMEDSSKLRILKIINLNFEPTAGAIYYMTLSLLEISCGNIFHYQAKIWEKINSSYKVDIFQLAPYVPRISEYQDFSMKVNNLQDWMDENYLYYKCCYRYKRLVSVVVIRDEENGESLGYGFINFNKKSAAMEFLESNNGGKMPNSNQIYSLEI
ncbi:uncharacterized protein [Solanum lycopersicum]|uniref:uncharacterized protein n=1 Tax=Solanum lycopersicum TaxID=4081 RepID=UPI00374A8740